MVHGVGDGYAITDGQCDHTKVGDGRHYPSLVSQEIDSLAMQIGRAIAAIAEDDVDALRIRGGARNNLTGGRAPFDAVGSGMLKYEAIKWSGYRLGDSAAIALLQRLAITASRSVWLARICVMQASS